MKFLKRAVIAFLILMIILYGAFLFLYPRNFSHGPVIISSQDTISVSCKYKEKDLLQGLTAYDPEEGDLTKEILIRNFSDFTEPGTAVLDYAVYDSSRNFGTYSRKVVFNDYLPPSITLKEPYVFLEGQYTDYILREYLNGQDSLDGDVTKHIEIKSSDVDFTEPGTYTLSVSLQNSFGDSISLDLPVHILENHARGLSLSLTDAVVYIEVGGKLAPEKYLKGVQDQLENRALAQNEYDLKISSEVDPSKPGVYQVRYMAYSKDETRKGVTWLTVVVRDQGGRHDR